MGVPVRAEWTDVHLSGRPQGGESVEVCVYALSCRLGSFIIFASLLSVAVVDLEARSILKASLWESRRDLKALRPDASGAGCSFMSHPIDGVDEREEEEEKRKQQQKELFSAPATVGTKSV